MKAIKELITNKKLVLFLYICGWLASLIWAIPFYKALMGEVGNTLSLESIFKSFDIYTLGDLIYNLPDEVKSYGFKFFLTILIFRSFYIFFSGGIIDSIIENDFKLKRFIIKSGRFLGKTIQLAIVCILFIALGSAFSFFIYEGLSQWIATPDFRQQYFIFFIPLLIFTFFLLITLMIWDYTRIFMISEKYKFGLKPALKIIFSSYYPFVSLIIILALILIVGLIYRYWLWGYYTGLIILQQIYIIFRLFMRLLYLKLSSNFIRENQKR